MSRTATLWERDGYHAVCAQNYEHNDFVSIGVCGAQAWAGDWLHIPRAAIPALAEYLAGLVTVDEDPEAPAIRATRKLAERRKEGVAESAEHGGVWCCECKAKRYGNIVTHADGCPYMRRLVVGGDKERP